MLINVLSRIPIVGGPFQTRLVSDRHQWVLLFGDRQNHTFTQFVRLPHQGEALAGPVVDFLRSSDDREPLRIVVFGCSNGAEPYSMASILASRRPDVSFHVTATDIDAAMIEKALSGRYSHEELIKNGFVSEDFVAATFHRKGESSRHRGRAEISSITSAGSSREGVAHLVCLLKPKAALSSTAWTSTFGTTHRQGRSAARARDW